MRFHLRTALLAFAIPLSLSGCFGDTPAGVKLPPLPADLRMECPGPDLSKVQDARIAERLEHAARLNCADLHQDTIEFYDDLRGISAQ